jgi:hypothetical protein
VKGPQLAHWILDRPRAVEPGVGALAFAVEPGSSHSGTAWVLDSGRTTQSTGDRHAMGTSSKLFARRHTATQADLEHAEMLLDRDGLIPVEDKSGHSGALELWRRQCERAASSRLSMVTAVRNVLGLPHASFQRAFHGQGETDQLAWVRPADIWFRTGSDFRYHFTVEGLAQLASNLIAEQGDPNGMARILGDDYRLETVAAPHGLLHEISQNGNHRTVAIKAAGFPVALVHTTRYDGPWMLPPRPWVSGTARVFLRLLFRACLLTNPQLGDYGINADANSWANLLLADTVGATLRNVAAYEQFYGRCEAWPTWSRNRYLLTKLLDRELLAMDSYNDLSVFSQVVGQWPPPVASRWRLLMLHLTRTGVRIDRDA